MIWLAIVVPTVGLLLAVLLDAAWWTYVLAAVAAGWGAAIGALLAPKTIVVDDEALARKAEQLAALRAEQQAARLDRMDRLNQRRYGA
jgi:hypothetical protein